MKKNQLERRAYTCPAISIYGLPMEGLLQSATGQHKNAGSGGSSGDAKEDSFWDEEEEGEKEELEFMY